MFCTVFLLKYDDVTTLLSKLAFYYSCFLNMLLSQLKGEALRTLAAMKNTKDEGFNALFMTKIDFSAKFDYHVRFVCVLSILVKLWVKNCIA